MIKADLLEGVQLKAAEDIGTLGKLKNPLIRRIFQGIGSYRAPARLYKQERSPLNEEVVEEIAEKGSILKQIKAWIMDNDRAQTAAERSPARKRSFDPLELDRNESPDTKSSSGWVKLIRSSSNKMETTRPRATTLDQSPSPVKPESKFSAALRRLITSNYAAKQDTGQGDTLKVKPQPNYMNESSRRSINVRPSTIMPMDSMNFKMGRSRSNTLHHPKNEYDESVKQFQFNPHFAEMLYKSFKKEYQLRELQHEVDAGRFSPRKQREKSLEAERKLSHLHAIPTEQAKTQIHSHRPSIMVAELMEETIKEESRRPSVMNEMVLPQHLKPKSIGDLRAFRGFSRLNCDMGNITENTVKTNKKKRINSLDQLLPIREANLRHKQSRRTVDNKKVDKRLQSDIFTNHLIQQSTFDSSAPIASTNSTKSSSQLTTLKDPYTGSFKTY